MYSFYSSFDELIKIKGYSFSNTVDTGRKLNVHKTFRRRPGRLLNVLCTFNLRPVFLGKEKSKLKQGV